MSDSCYHQSIRPLIALSCSSSSTKACAARLFEAGDPVRKDKFGANRTEVMRDFTFPGD
jgi:hypothetical protein